MEGKNGVSHSSEGLEGSAEPEGSVESKKREAKGTCLKIEGQDGYVFKSYSLTPHDPAGAKPPAGPSATLANEPSPSVTSPPGDASANEPSTAGDAPDQASSQVEEQSAVSDEAMETSPPKPLKTEMEIKKEKDEDEHIQGDAGDQNGTDEDRVQDDKESSFDSSVGPFVTRDNDDYSNLLSGYTSTLYDVAMDAVTQSLLSSMRSPANPRKKSPAWNHFCISPRDSTKAICMYCMKEFSRGKNEKDLSTSCLMRHVRRAHPTLLLQDGDSTSSNHLTNSVASSLLPPSNSPKNGDVPAAMATPASRSNASLSAEASASSSKEAVPKLEPKPEPCATSDLGAASPSHSNSHNNHGEDATDGVPERFQPSTSKSSSSRRRSAVWKHFYLSPADSSKAVCIHCMNEFSRGKNGKDLGTSCLIRHMWRAHKEIVIEENGQGSHIPPPYTYPPTLLSRAQIQEPVEIKKESPLPPSSPETISDEAPRNSDVNMEVKEESEDTLDISGQESSLTFQGLQGDDSHLLSTPCDPSECSSLNPDQSSVFQQNKKIMKRVKSEVWHHFIVSPVDQLKALCRYCPCVISRGKRGDFGTSCLMRHLMRRHPDVLKNQKSTEEPSPHLYASLTSSTNAGSPKETERSPVSEKKSQTLPVFSKKTSKLWNHFSISPTDPTKVVCLHCSRTISRGKKTTNLGTSCLFRHMQRFHGHVLESNKNNSGDAPSAEFHVKQELMDAASAYEENGERFDEFHPVAKKITQLVAEMLALDLQPSALVENAGLNRLLEYLQPQYSLPSPSFFTSTAIPDMYERVKEVVLTHLKEAESGVVHFTSSIWVSSQTREYLTLTAHWASYESVVRPQGQDFHCSALLSVALIDGDHDTLSIQKQLEYLWDTWISSSGLKKGFTVTDNDAIRNVLEDADHESVQCFGHTVDLIVNEAIKSQRMVQNLLSIARKICERVQRSSKAKLKLAELQRVHELPENQLVQDVPSKWRTSFLMLERLVEQKKAIDEMSIECNFREMISCDQWEVMLSVCNALKPFDVACSEMSNRTATLGQVIPLIHILNRKIDMLFDETMGIDNMLKSLKDSMVTRMSSTLQDPRYTWATMLDPRYKTSLFTEEEAEQCKQELIRELEEVSVSTSSETKTQLSNGGRGAPLSNKDSLWSLMEDIRHKIKQEEKPKSSELAVVEYLEEDILDQSCDPLDYWNLRKFQWPALSKVAVRYVACPPSIVPAETLFSTASVNCTLNQPRPLLDNMESLLFLKVNLPLIFFQY